MAGSKNSNYFDFLKKLAPTLAKEEGDIINRQLAKEVAERGAQLDNPTLAEQLKSIKLPEEQRGFVIGEASDIARPPVLHEPVNLPVPSQGKLPAVIETPQTLELDPSSFTDLSKLDEKLANVNMAGPQTWQAKLDKLREFSNANKGKLAAGGTGLALMAASGNGQQPPAQAITEVPSTTSANALKAAEIEQPETEEEKAVKAQIRQLSSTSGGSGDQPTVVDFGSAPSIASLERLQQLQQQANENSRWARMAQAFSQARAGMTGQAEDRFSKGYDEDIKAIQNVPEQYKQQVAFEKEDPNSPISKGYRDLAKKVYDIDIQGSASAADIEKQFPQFANLKSGKEARLARAEELKLRYAAMQDTKKQAADLKNQDKQTKAIENYAKIASKEYERLSKLEQAVQALDMKNIKDSGPSDVAALYSFIKLLDPESVVREGEIALARSGMSMPQRLRNAIKNAAYGGVIDKEFRAEMAIIGKHLAEQGSSRYHKSLAHQRNILKNRYNLKDEDIAEYDPALVANKQTEAPPIPKQPTGSNISSKEPIGKSGLTPQQRQAEIQQLRQELGIK